MKNGKTTKRALVSSTLALFLCVAMLIGTTFAWFTDAATTGVNKIQAGNLDVALEMYEDGEWVSAEGKTLNFVAKDGNENILWEPGCTYETVPFRVVNKGNLALKYKFVITGIGGDEKLNDAIEWTYDYIFANGSTTSYPLENLNSAQTVLKPAGTELSDYEARGFKLVGHMKKEAGNEYQGLSIDNISITVVATQAQYENDSYGNTYDKDAGYPEVITAADFAKLLTPDDYDPNTTTAVEVSLDKDYFVVGDWTTMNYPVNAYKVRLNSLTIDGNGHTIFGINAPLIEGNTAQNMTIKNLTISGSNIVNGNENGMGKGAFVNYADSTETSFVMQNCHLVNSTVTAENNAGAFVGYISHIKAEISDCTVTGCTISGEFAGGFTGFDMTNTQENHSISNCTITNTTVTASRGAGQIVGRVNAGGTLEINNCKFDGKAAGNIITGTTVLVDGVAQ